MKLVKGSPEAKAYMAKLRAMAGKRREIRAGQDMPSTSKGQKPLDFSGKRVYGAKKGRRVFGSCKSCGGNNWDQYAFRNFRCLDCGSMVTREDRFSRNPMRAYRPFNWNTLEACVTEDVARQYAEKFSREQLASSLQQNDRNGCWWPDELAEREVGHPTKKEDAVEGVVEIWRGMRPAKNPARRSASEKALDKQIEAAYYRVASGVQVSIMDVPKIFADAKALLASGRADIDQVLIEVVKRYQTAVGGGRMLNNPGARKNPPAFIVIDSKSGVVQYRTRASGMGTAALNAAIERATDMAAQLGRSFLVFLDIAGYKVGAKLALPMVRVTGATEVFPDGRVTRSNPKFKARFIASDGEETRTASLRAHGTRSALKKAERMTLDMPHQFRGPRSEVEVIRCNPKTCKNPGHRHGRRNPTDVLGRGFAPGFVIWHTTSQAEAHNALRILQSNHIPADMEAVPADLKKFGGWVYKIHVERPTDSITRMILEGVLNRISSESIYGQMSGQWQSLPKMRPSKAARRTMRKNPLLQMVTLANPVSDGWVVTRDGETLKAGFKTDGQAMAFLHKYQGQSVDRAIRYEGYDIVQVQGGKAVWSYKRNVIQKLGRGRQNPAAPAKPPFKHGQIITVQQALDYARRSGNASLVKQCQDAIKLCKKANGSAQKVRFDLVAMGDPKKIDATVAMVEYGATDETVYTPPKGSKKGAHLYRHDWSEGKRRKVRVPLLASPSGKALIMPLQPGQKASDWLRG